MRRLLLERAMALIDTGGRVPSVSEVALAAGVSRATAYRYFPTRSKLIAAVVDLSLGPVRATAPPAGDGPERVKWLFESTFSRFSEFEPQMRAALQLALEHSALQKAGLLKEEQYRRGYRVGLLREVLAPLKDRLSPRVHRLLSRSLSLVYGIESYVVLKDIWGASDAEVEAVARWMVGALVGHALAEPGAVRAGTCATDRRDASAAATPKRTDAPRAAKPGALREPATRGRSAAIKLR